MILPAKPSQPRAAHQRQQDRAIRMIVTLRAMAAARRNVLQRIGRFLDLIDQEKRSPTLWETWSVEDALLLVEAGTYNGAERSIMEAEKADEFGTSKAVALIAPKAELRSVAELRERHSKILSDGA